MYKVLLILLATVAATTGLLAQHGQAWQHHPQIIPGRVEAELYNTGGEGIAYHDADSVNNGSGKLNPVNGNPLHAFRMNEGVDISYTKSGGVDDNAYNTTMPAMQQLYLGWTQPGEWVNYTVNVREPGNYRLAIMYTAHEDGAVALGINGQMMAERIVINSTYQSADTVAWRQWHHWNKQNDAARLLLKKGIQTITLHITEKGNMNFDYLEFIKE